MVILMRMFWMKVEFSVIITEKCKKDPKKTAMNEKSPLILKNKKNATN